MNEVKYEPNVKSADLPCRERPVYDSKMSPFPAMTVVGMGYVPFQQWDNVYTAEVGLERGTLFADLDKPYIGEVMPR